MAAQLAPAPAPVAAYTAGQADVHLYCCDPELALCGTDLTRHSETSDDTSCVVCTDLEEADVPCGPACH